MKKTTKTLRIAGLMSGTSADGVDVTIIDFDGRQANVLAFQTFPYSPAIRRKVFHLFDPAASRVDEICRMNVVLGEVFAEAVIRLARKHKIRLDSIDLIGSHGQTIYHLPQSPKLGKYPTRSTLQIGEPSVIAERTGITTVADFRPRDIAAGGQGAPLVPYTDFILFGDPKKTRAIQNIGGIANVTFLPARGTTNDVLAFDTGPGNMIIDHLTARLTGDRHKFDVDGKLAARGRTNAHLLADLMRHPYLKQPPPKSTGRELFGINFTDSLFNRAKQNGIGDHDLLATVTTFTAHCIADAYHRFLPRPVDEVILCGGGAKNPVLVTELKRILPKTDIIPMNERGINPDAKEAVSFAILAWATIHGIPSNVPSATGAKHPAVLGKIISGKLNCSRRSEHFIVKHK